MAKAANVSHPQGWTSDSLPKINYKDHKIESKSSKINKLIAKMSDKKLDKCLKKWFVLVEKELLQFITKNAKTSELQDICDMTNNLRRSKRIKYLN